MALSYTLRSSSPADTSRNRDLNIPSPRPATRPPSGSRRRHDGESLSEMRRSLNTPMSNRQRIATLAALHSSSPQLVLDRSIGNLDFDGGGSRSRKTRERRPPRRTRSSDDHPDFNSSFGSSNSENSIILNDCFSNSTEIEDDGQRKPSSDRSRGGGHYGSMSLNESAGSMSLNDSVSLSLDDSFNRIDDNGQPKPASETRRGSDRRKSTSRGARGDKHGSNALNNSCSSVSLDESVSVSVSLSESHSECFDPIEDDEQRKPPSGRRKNTSRGAICDNRRSSVSSKESDEGLRKPSSETSRGRKPASESSQGIWKPSSEASLGSRKPSSETSRGRNPPSDTSLGRGRRKPMNGGADIDEHPACRPKSTSRHRRRAGSSQKPRGPGGNARNSRSRSKTRSQSVSRTRGQNLRANSSKYDDQNEKTSSNIGSASRAQEGSKAKPYLSPRANRRTNKEPPTPVSTRSAEGKKNLVSETEVLSFLATTKSERSTRTIPMGEESNRSERGNRSSMLGPKSEDSGHSRSRDRREDLTGSSRAGPRQTRGGVSRSASDKPYNGRTSRRPRGEIRRSKSSDDGNLDLAAFLNSSQTPVSRRKKLSASRSVASMPARVVMKQKKARSKQKTIDQHPDLTDSTKPPSSRSSVQSEDLENSDGEPDVSDVVFAPESLLQSALALHMSRTENLLFDVFPKHIAEALREGRKVEPENHDCVTIFFSDIVGFTDISSELDPMKVSDMLDRLYSSFDALSHYHDVFKVETIGDAYMATTNLTKNQPDHSKRIAEFAIDAIRVANQTLIDKDNAARGFVNIRVGFHSGSVVSNVVGSRNPRYCLFGDTVNTASRMESNSAPNRIHCSESSALLLKQQCPELKLNPRGVINVKGKGDMHTFWVNEDETGHGQKNNGVRSVYKMFRKKNRRDSK